MRMRGRKPSWIAWLVIENAPEITACEAITVAAGREQRPSAAAPRSGNSLKNGLSIASRVDEQQRALADVVERQRREHQDEPGQADRPRAEVAHVGVERLGAGDARGRRRRARRSATGAVAEQEPERVERIEAPAGCAGVADLHRRPSAARTRNQTIITGPNSVPMPAVPSLLEQEQARPARRAVEHDHVGVPARGAATSRPSTAAEHRDRRRDDAVADRRARRRTCP